MYELARLGAQYSWTWAIAFSVTPYRFMSGNRIAGKTCPNLVERYKRKAAVMVMEKSDYKEKVLSICLPSDWEI